MAAHCLGIGSPGSDDDCDDNDDDTDDCGYCNDVMMTMMITMRNCRRGFHTPAVTPLQKVSFSYLLVIMMKEKWDDDDIDLIFQFSMRLYLTIFSPYLHTTKNQLLVNTMTMFLFHQILLSL